MCAVEIYEKMKIKSHFVIDTMTREPVSDICFLRVYKQ